ncbi:MAG: universal stress protein [Aristaeellaceae bacterium]
MAETVLVCVTGQKSSERLIHKGAEIAREHQATLLVLSVSGSGLNTLANPAIVQILDELYGLSCQVGAEMTMIHSHDAHKTICDFCRERGVTRMVLGQSRDGNGAFVFSLMRSLPQVAFTIEPNA